MTYLIGFDIGGTNIKYVAARPEGELLETGALATADTPQARQYWIDLVEARIAGMRGSYGEPQAVGIAAPGLAARDARSIAWMQGRMEAVQGLDWTLATGSSQLVPVVNDAHAALLGEVWCGAAARSRDVVLLTLGTGVGGACMVDGRLLSGNIGRAGHLGHICLNPDAEKDIVNTPGSLEDAIGECSLLKRTHGRFSSTQALVAAHRLGDPMATEVWRKSVHSLACAIVSIVNVVDPEVVILGGGIAGAGEDLFIPLAEWMEEYEWRPTGSRVRIVPAALGEYAGAYGAAYRGLQASGSQAIRQDT